MMYCKILLKGISAVVPLFYIYTLIKIKINSWPAKIFFVTENEKKKSLISYTDGNHCEQ